MFRLAETLRVADPAQIEEKLPPALIADWLKYFEHKDTRFDKVEYYLVQLSALIAGIAGADDLDLVWDRGDGKRAEKTQKISPEAAERLFRAAFGV